MAKFCQYCGAKLNEEQEVCLKCGRTIRKVEEKGKKETKKNHNTYFLITGLLMCLLGLLFFALSGSEEEYLGSFVCMGVFAGAGGICTLIGKNNKNPYTIKMGGILYIIGALINIFEIMDISIFTILCLIFAPLNIMYSKQM